MCVEWSPGCRAVALVVAAFCRTLSFAADHCPRTGEIENMSCSHSSPAFETVSMFFADKFRARLARFTTGGERSEQ